MELFHKNNQTYFIDPKTNEIVLLTNEHGKLIYETDKFVDISYQSMKSLPRMLSNLYPYDFDFEGNNAKSIEGVIQALKHPEIDIQKEVIQYAGVDAYHTRGATSGPYTTLYWMGEKMDRFGVDYQLFLNDLFLSVYYQSGLYRKAFEMIGNRIVLHSIGKTDPYVTTLTVDEYIGRLNILKNDMLDLQAKEVELHALANEFANKNTKIRKKLSF